MVIDHSVLMIGYLGDRGTDMSFLDRDSNWENRHLPRRSLGVGGSCLFVEGTGKMPVLPVAVTARLSVPLYAAPRTQGITKEMSAAIAYQTSGVCRNRDGQRRWFLHGGRGDL